MKRLLKLLGSLLGLLALAVLVIALTTTFRNLRGESQPASSLFQSPIETPTQPPYPLPGTPTPSMPGTPTIVPTPSGVWRAENIVVISKKALDVPIEMIGTEGTRLIIPKVSPNGQKVLFERYTGKYVPCYEASKTCFYPESELWIYSLSSGRWLRLDGPATQGSWSSDSRQIAYLAQVGPGQYDLRRIEAEGRSPYTLVQDVKRAQPYWRNQQNIVYLDRDGSITQVSVLDSTRQVLSSIKVQNPGGPMSFALSGDGRTLAIVSQRQVWLVPLDRQGESLLLTPPYDYLAFSNVIGGMAWSRDGRYIALSSGTGYITVYDRKGQFISTISAGGETVYSLRWSPNGSSLAALSEKRAEAGPQNDIVIANIDGSVVRALGFTESKKHSMDWSPKGIHLLWAADFQQAPFLVELNHR